MVILEIFRQNLIQIASYKMVGGGAGMPIPCAAFRRGMQISKSEKIILGPPLLNPGYAPVSLPSLEPLSFTFVSRCGGLWPPDLSLTPEQGKLVHHYFSNL